VRRRNDRFFIVLVVLVCFLEGSCEVVVIIGGHPRVHNLYVVQRAVSLTRTLPLEAISRDVAT